MASDGSEVRATWIDDRQLRVGETHFVCAFPFDDAPDGSMQVMKNRDVVERYVDLIDRIRPTRIVELGINRGGSTALLSELARPTKLVAFEINSVPVDALSAYIERRELRDTVRPFYAVDQSDRTRLAEVLDAELDGGEPIDLVVDDASHLYRETRASFETLFPRLRPGGLFLIEDWRWQHRVGDGIAAALEDHSREDHAELRRTFREAVAASKADPLSSDTPLSRLVVELLLTRASSGDTIREVTINSNWAVVERGADPIDLPFRLDDHHHDHYGFLN